ncbi:unnamed protein product [Tilletia caries]|nr:unnamed protein product [Tilletia caries]CAD7061062.1 unnamed protein product [Tilletia caries]
MPPISSLFADSPHQVLTSSPTAARRKTTILSGTRLFKAGNSSEVITPSSSRSFGSSQFRETAASTSFNPNSASSSLVSVAKALHDHPEDDGKETIGKHSGIGLPSTPQRKASHTILRRILQRPFRHKDVLSPSPTPSPSTDALSSDSAGNILLPTRPSLTDGNNLHKMTERAAEDNKRSHRYTWTSSPPSTPTTRMGGDHTSIRYDSNVPSAPRKIQNLESAEALFTRYFHHAERHSTGSALMLSTPIAPSNSIASRRVTFIANDLGDSDSSDSQSQHSAIGALRGNQSADTSQQLGPLKGSSVTQKKPAATSSSSLRAAATSAAADKSGTNAPPARLSRFIPRSLRSWGSRLSISSVAVRDEGKVLGASGSERTQSMQVPTSSTLPQLLEDGPSAINTNADPTHDDPQHSPGHNINPDLLREAAEFMARFNADFEDAASEESSVVEAIAAEPVVERSKSSQSLLERLIGAHRLSMSKSTRSLKALQRGTAVGTGAARMTVPTTAATLAATAAPVAVAAAAITETCETTDDAVLSTPRQHTEGAFEHQAAAQPSPLDASCHGYQPLPVQHDSHPNISAWLHAVAQANFMERYDLELSVRGTEMARAELIVQEERLPHPGACSFFRLSTTDGAEEGLTWCQIQSLPISTDAGSTAVGGSDVDADSDGCSDIDERFRNALDEHEDTDPASAATAVFPDVVSRLGDLEVQLTYREERFKAYPSPKKLYQAISNRCLSLFRKGEAVRPAEGRYRVPGRALPQPLSLPQAKPQLKPQPKLKPQPQTQPKPELQPGPSQSSPSTNSNRLKRHVGPVVYSEFSSTESDSTSDDEEIDDYVENRSPAEGSSFSRRQPSRNNQPRNSASARIEPALRTESAVDPSKSRTSHSPLSRRQTTSRKGKERLVESSSASDVDVTSHIDAQPHKKIRVIGSFGGSDSDLEDSGTSAQSTPQPECIAKTSLAARVASTGAQRTPTKSRRGTREDKVRLADGTCVSRDLVQAFVQLAPNTTSVIEEALDELSATSSPPLGASSRTASSSDPNSSSRSTNHHPAPTGVSLDVLQPWIRAHLALQGNTSMPENANKRFKVDRMTELVVLSLVENEELVELEGGLYAKRSASSRT